MNLVRHQSVFDPHAIAGSIAIAGVGALGSALALQLAKLGCGARLVLFDPDVVEDHNLPNQVLYGPDDIGVPKVEAAALTLESLVGVAPHSHKQEALTSSTQLWGVSHLFVCVDSMRARRDIFERCVRDDVRLAYFSEGRMNARSVMAVAFQPTHQRNTTYLRDCMYPDEDVPPDLGTCGNVLSIGATATMLACQMTWALINHNAGQPRWEELHMSVDDVQVTHRGWLGDEYLWRKLTRATG